MIKKQTTQSLINPENHLHSSLVNNHNCYQTRKKFVHKSNDCLNYPL